MTMLKTALRNSMAINRKTAAVNIVLVANAFVWYFHSYFLLKNAIDTSRFSNDAVTIFGISFAALATSAIVSAHLARRLKSRLRFLIYWMLVGVPISLVPILIDLSTFAGLLTLSALFGFYFGSGMPICLDYFASTTGPGNRARSGGIIFFLTGIGFVVLTGIGMGETTLSAIVLSVWRGIGLAILVALRPGETPTCRSEKVSFRFIVSNKPFLLYFIPWFLFMLVNVMMNPLITKLFGNLLPNDLVELSTGINSVIAFTVALVSGFFADYAGRKRMTVGGFALLGLGYAALGLFPGNLTGYWFYTIVDGITWGIFYTVFLITIWGDLAQESASEKYSALGSLPYLLSVFARISLGTYIVNLVPNYGFFSYASVFLFLAVLPLIYAPETLPEKIMKDRELKTYLERAQKIATKAHEKDDKQAEKEEKDVGLEFKVEQEDMEKAEELAQKYY